MHDGNCNQSEFSVFDLLPISLTIIDLDSEKIIFANKKILNLLNYKSDCFDEAEFEKYYKVDDLENTIKHVIKGNRVVDFIFERNDEEYILKSLVKREKINGRDVIVASHIRYEEIAKMAADSIEGESLWLASGKKDKVTGLFDKNTSLLFLESNIKSIADGQNFTVAYLKAEEYENVEQEHGQEGTEYLMKSMSQVIKSIIRNSDFFSSLSKDSFLIVFPGAPKHVVDDIAKIIYEKLLVVSQTSKYSLSAQHIVYEVDDKQTTASDILETIEEELINEYEE